jgi:hypothetical protein
LQQEIEMHQMVKLVRVADDEELKQEFLENNSAHLLEHYAVAEQDESALMLDSDFSGTRTVNLVALTAVRYFSAEDVLVSVAHDGTLWITEEQFEIYCL